MSQTLAIKFLEESISADWVSCPAKSDCSCCLWLLKIQWCQTQQLRPGAQGPLFITLQEGKGEGSSILGNQRHGEWDKRWKLRRETEEGIESRNGDGEWIREEWERDRSQAGAIRSKQSLLFSWKADSVVIPIWHWRNGGTETWLKLSGSSTDFKSLT